MFRMSFLVVSLLVSLAVFGSDQVIDGTDGESAKSSINEMVAGLPEEKAQQLGMALLRIQLSQFGSVTEVPAEYMHGLNYEYLSGELDGLGYEEILELADKSPVTATVSE